MLLDSKTLELGGSIDDVLAALPDQPWATRVTPELFESTAEVATGICSDVDDARRDLSAIRRGLATAARAARACASAARRTHPFSLSENQRITPRDRYRNLLEQLQYVARRELVFGMHVHVAVPDPETCMKVMEGVLIELPVLLALSANSPFWRGGLTGLASTRTAVFAALPALRPAAEVRLLRRLRRHDRLDGVDRRDRRLHAHLVGRPAAPAPRHASSCASWTCSSTSTPRSRSPAYVQALVAALIDDVESGKPTPSVPPPADRREQVERRPLRARGAADGPRHRPPHADRGLRRSRAAA